MCLKYAYQRTFKEQISWYAPHLGEGVGIGYQNEETLKFVPSRLLRLLT